MSNPTSSHSASASAQPVWLLVAAREIGVKLRDRNFLISTATTLAIMVIAFGISFAMSSRTSTETVAYSTPEAGEVLAAVVPGSGPGATEIEPLSLTDDDAVRAAVAQGDAAAGLVDTGGQWTLVGDSEVPGAVSSAVTEAVTGIVAAQNAADAGTSLEQIYSGTQVGQELLSPGADGGEAASLIAGFAFVFLFYLGAVLFGYGIASSVMEEKQSRVVEILAASIPLRQLLFGKIVGATVLALAQLALIVGVALAGLALTEYSDMVPSIGGAAAWYLAFFVVGFAGIAALFAVSGSLGTRAEDVQSTSTPVLMLVMIAAFGGLLLDGVGRVVASYVPIMSTVAMPLRLVDGEAAWWEPVVALVLAAAAVAAIVWLAERIYRRALLQTGSSLSWKQALTTS